MHELRQFDTDIYIKDFKLKTHLKKTKNKELESLESFYLF